MPSSIPYDSSLALGSIVHPNRLKNLEQISALQGPIDAAEERLNSSLAMKRSLQMTINELIDLAVDTGPLHASIMDADKTISEAATKYVKTKITNEAQILDLKSAIRSVHEDFESPIDYNNTQIKKMPLSSDSLKMDCQYFSYGSTNEDAHSAITSIKSYVANSTSFLGDSFSAQASATAATQASQQHRNHDVSGTLVVSISCTHKDAAVLAPFILDVDKAIRVWNRVYLDDKDKIKPDDAASILNISRNSNTAKEPDIQVLSGATYGSSFIGMVHTLRQEATSSGEQMISTAASMQAQFDVGAWFVKESGGFGVDESFTNSIKSLLSTQSITSHVSLISMGCIPSIKSNQVKLGVQEFADFDPAKMMDKLAVMSNATRSEQASVADKAEKARTGGQMMAIQNAEVKGVLSGLAEIDDGANKMLDINSMMTALEDYVEKALAGNLGVPINYYTKSITRSQLAQMWVSKYFPGKYLSIAGDDSTPAPAPAPTPAQP